LNKFFLITITLLFSASVFAADSEKISFTKKEIAFFKWGSGEYEVGLSKNESPNILHGQDLGGKKVVYDWFRRMELDGSDNIYFANGNGQIIIVSSDGHVRETISMEKTGGLKDVDDVGDIYGNYFKKGEPTGFIITKPDGTQTVYKNFMFGGIENGIVYPLRVKEMEGKAPITVFLNKDTPVGNLPRSLMSPLEQMDFDNPDYHTFIIHTEKLNKRLKARNRKIDVDKISIKTEPKGRWWPINHLIGLDDDGDSYILCEYSNSSTREGPEFEADVMVYSQNGQKIIEVPIGLDYFDKHISSLKTDIEGSVFQMWANKDGIHILKWTKN